MAIDLKVSVSEEISQLKKNIAQRTSELASLKDELKRDERVYELLSDNRARRHAPRRRDRKSGRVDWKSVLEGLPKTFTISSAAQRGRLSAKAKTYLRGVLVRWVKKGKVKRIERGKYQKVQ